MKEILARILKNVAKRRLSKEQAMRALQALHEKSETVSSGFLHPLLHYQISASRQQIKFKTVFTGSEFYIADHWVNGRPVLAGVASLEMVRAALLHSFEQGNNTDSGIQIKNFVWISPLIMRDKDISVEILLTPNTMGDVQFKIKKEGDLENKILCQGTANFTKFTNCPRQDLIALKDNNILYEYSSEDCYQKFESVGISYGSSLKGIEKLYVGPDYVLAKLSLPSICRDDAYQYALHPSILDGAIGATIGSVLRTPKGANENMSTDDRVFLPYAVDEIQVYSDCLPSMWAIIDYSKTIQNTDKNIRKVNVDICDEHGLVAVRLKGFTTKALEKEREIETDSNDESKISKYKTILSTPVWDEITIEKTTDKPGTDKKVLIIGGDNVIFEKIKNIFPDAKNILVDAKLKIPDIQKILEKMGIIDHLIWITPFVTHLSFFHEEHISRQEQGVIFCFRILKALLELGYGEKEIEMTFVTIQALSVKKYESFEPTHASIHGLVGSVSKEYRSWKIKVFDLDSTCEWPLIEMFHSAPATMGNVLAFRKGIWYEQKLIPLIESDFKQSVYIEKGVYVVVGGAGGIGQTWSEYVIRNYQAQVIWIGRRQMNQDIQGKIERLSKLGPPPVYITADATDKRRLSNAYLEIKKRFNSINGIVHSAIVLRDKSLKLMDEKTFRAVLSAKVDVSVRIAQVFKKEKLDFLLFFSSFQSFSNSPGQSNYAAGCNFKDAYAHSLMLQMPGNIKIVNWGYWGSVGVVSSPVYNERMEKMGVGSINPEEGMAILERLLAGPIPQIAVTKITDDVQINDLQKQEYIVCDNSTEVDVDIVKIVNNVPQSNEDVQAIIKVSKEFETELNGYLCMLLWHQLGSLGIFQEQHFSVKDIISRFTKTNTHAKWLLESIQALLRASYIKLNGDSGMVVAESDKNDHDVWQLWDQFKGVWQKDPNRKAQITLVDTTLRALPDILKGKKTAIEIMFPMSSTVLVEGIYKNNKIADYFNDMLSALVVEYMREKIRLDPSIKLRILEIGAGTGGTSVSVLEKLAPFQKNIGEYCYTDISASLLLYAENAFGKKYSFLKFSLFDVEKSIAIQEIDQRYYDVVIAANVLHATKDICLTLRHAKATLKKDGIILLNEITQNTLNGHLTFGLLDGWWAYEDSALRIQGCPGLEPEVWRFVLEKEGFDKVSFPVRDSHSLGLQIILAKSDGIIRLDKENIIQKSKLPNKIKSLDLNIDLVENSETSIKKRPSEEPEMEKYDEISPESSQRGTFYVKSIIRDSIARILKVDEPLIENDTSFAEYGVDSINAVKLINVINEKCKTEMPVTCLFDYNNIDMLTNYIVDQYSEIIENNVIRKEKDTEWQKDDDRTNGGKYEENIEPDIPLQSQEYIIKKDRDDIQRTDNKSSFERHILKKPIAIIGMSGKFPQSQNLKELWDHLAAGDELISKVTRWDMSDSETEALKKGVEYCHAAGFIEDFDQFDPLFFKISGLEATYMDPQQRLFLEESWKALEDSGYAGEYIEGKKCGVYVGGACGEYKTLFDENPPASSFWGNSASIMAARIAYFLDLKGPAVAIDTACSSSLLAIHLACQGLWTNEIEMAVAGGVFLMTSPEYLKSANRAGMLSPKGHSYVFDNRADGFVPGEGVGVVVLKRLEDAIESADHIYGVISGSGTNQDGRTNGITAPSIKSQETLENQVYEEFNINPQSIQMIEAHGTGTKLGDPIEFEALKNVFSKYTDKKNFCSIGSIKSNIGHTGYAAGIAGVFKILLSLQQKKIPPLLNFESENQNICFQNSPFIVNTELQDWATDNNAKRCAAVSSFGFSGTNVHIVIEQAPNIPRTYSKMPGYLIVLSARTPDQLTHYVKKLFEYCTDNSAVDCGDMSYTLLIGRKHFNHRFACIAKNINDLKEKLAHWLENGITHNQLFVSEIDEKISEQKSLQIFGNEFIQRCSTCTDESKYIEMLSAISHFYVQGYPLNYNNLFNEKQYKRISLPTYPFNRDRYWVNEGKVPSSRKTVVDRSSMHPLVQKNTSDFFNQKYVSTFTGNEFFFRDHIVNGQRVLPGVAYFEIARKSIFESMRISENQPKLIVLRNITWIQPITVFDQPVQIITDLSLENEGVIEYKIFSNGNDSQMDEVIHCQGSAYLNEAGDRPFLNISDLQKECNVSIHTADECYRAFKTAGIELGLALRGIDCVYKGQDKVLAKLAIPASIYETKNQFYLHPTMVDSALQAGIALRLNSQDDSGKQEKSLSIPFMVEELKIYSQCSTNMWAVVRYGTSKESGEQAEKIDMDLCDESGNVCVQVRGLILRQIRIQDKKSTKKSENELSINDIQDFQNAIALAPFWEETPLCLDSAQNQASRGENVLLVGEISENLTSIKDLMPHAHVVQDLEDIITVKLKNPGYIDHIVWIVPTHRPRTPEAEELITDQEIGVLKYFRVIKEMLGLGYETRKLTWTIITTNSQKVVNTDNIDCTHASLHGFVGSLAKEIISWKIRLVDMSVSGHWPVDTIFSLIPDSAGNAWCLRNGKWFKQKLMYINNYFSADYKTLYKRGGVYIVIGGAGGIGEVYSEYMIRTYAAQIVWVGRRKCNDQIQSKIARMAEWGPAPIYLCADAQDFTALENVYQTVIDKYKEVNGVIHSALVLHDLSIKNLEEEKFRAVLNVKVNVCIRIAQVFKKSNLDFVLFFSSYNSFSKSPGQSNYVSGCTFKDAFAYQMGEYFNCAVKIINWGYWAEVGAVSSSFYQDRMAQLGIGSIENSEGMSALEVLLSGPLNQVALIKTTKKIQLPEVCTEKYVTLYPMVIEENPHPSLNIQENKKVNTPDEPLAQLINESFQLRDMLDEVLPHILLGQLKKAGLFTNSKFTFTELKMPNVFDRLCEGWFNESFEILVKKGLCFKQGTEYYLSEKGEHLDPETCWREWDKQTAVWRDNQSTVAQMKLLDIMLRSLPEIICGRAAAVDVMFPSSSMERVEGVYRNNKVADYFNDVLTDFVTTSIEAKRQENPSARMRILEIGAGTGGTTYTLLKGLSLYGDNIEEYCYSDVSKVFLEYGETNFASEYDFMTFRKYDVSQSIQKQNFVCGSYDIVIAANVLHATKNISRTLQNVKTLLKTGGLLVLNELSSNTLFAHLSFGLLEGWWLSEDQEIRISGSPGLLPEKWQWVLVKEGFHSVEFLAPDAHKLGQQIIVCKSNGVILLPFKKESSSHCHKESVTQTPALRNDYLLKNTSKQIDPQPLSRSVPDNKNELLESNIKEIIVEKVCESLKIDKTSIKLNKPFSDYGVDSITGVNLVKLLNKDLNIDLDVTSIFDHSNINKLTTFIITQYNDLVKSKIQIDCVEHTIQMDHKDDNFQKTSEDNGYSPLSLSYKQKKMTMIHDKKRMIEIPRSKLTRYRGKYGISEASDLLVRSFEELNPKEINPDEFESNHLKTHAQVENKTANSNEKIAIIGMSGRFANTKDVGELWERLSAGADLIEEIKRWNLSTYFEKLEKSGKPYGSKGGFLTSIDLFDAAFFEISGLEATYMDPQQRFFLEQSWTALEDAGYVGPLTTGIRCGVYVGCGGGDYHKIIGDNENQPAQAFWGNAASITPARIAYYLDLHGPAIAIDTACSSSLVAIHLACQALRAGEIDMALSGGVFIQSTPGYYKLSNKAGMLSPTGHCYTFDDRADGFIPGEGCGVVILKRYQDAIKDGDNIYAVVKGSGINQDGATNGITAPSALSQESLETEVYDNFEINPEHIQMVEAHGTGTKLGDPIELNALKQAFGKYTQKKNYCAIGSVKTNIGHTGTAAGIAGVIKVLLSLKNKKIPPSINYKIPNTNINFEDSPFFVNTSLIDWKVEPGEKRAACISAFGFSGTNAHVVIEEADSKSREKKDFPGYLIVLSACTISQLQLQVKQLVDYCQENPGVYCQDMSYTLLMGRRHFHNRFACIASSINELIEVCQNWLKGEKNIAFDSFDLNTVDIKHQKVMERLGNESIKKCRSLENPDEYLENLHTIAHLYTQGYELDYQDLFNNGNHLRISLPTYPFEREHFWVSENEHTELEGKTNEGNGSKIHPLLHNNISDINGMRFVSKITGEENCLKDHVIKNTKIIPGVAFLEMAKAASDVVVPHTEGQQNFITFQDVSWIQPILIRKNFETVYLNLSCKANEELVFEVSTGMAGEKADRIIHCQGVLQVCTTPPLSEKYNLEMIKSSCSLGRIDHAECYSRFRSIGLEYGPGYKGIQSIYRGTDTLLVRISLPQEIFDNEGLFIHPGIMDSALQASSWLVGEKEADTLFLPSGIQKVELIHPCVSDMWGVIHSTSSEKNKNYAGLRSIDFDLCSDDGDVCVRVEGVSFQESPLTKRPEPLENKTIIMHPFWEEVLAATDQSAEELTEYHVLFCQMESITAIEMEKRLEGANCEVIHLKEDAIEKKFMVYTKHVFEKVKQIFDKKIQGAVLFQIVIDQGGDQRLLCGLSGFLKCAHLENPQFFGQVIECGTNEDPSQMIKVLTDYRKNLMENDILCVNGKTHVLRWEEDKIPYENDKILWKSDGVYLITGGIGGLGRILTQDIIQHVRKAKIILAGRSELNSEQESWLSKCKQSDAQVEYRQLDVSDLESVTSGVDWILTHYGTLNGIIHCAGIVQDNFIIKKTQEEISNVLLPKVMGVVNLDKASKDIHLDFFIMFSSGAAVFGNAGQADYAAANAFLDGYAEYRKEKVDIGKRFGDTLSINWPLWKNGGMNNDPDLPKKYWETKGLYPMENQDGMRALNHCAQLGQSRALVFKGDALALKKWMGVVQRPLGKVKEMESAEDQILSAEILKEKTENYIKHLMSKVIKVSPEKIHHKTSFDKYGVDSILQMQLIEKFEKDLGLLSKTLLFEYNNIGELVEYMIENHSSQLQNMFKVDKEDDTDDYTNIRNENFSRVNASDIQLDENLYPYLLKKRDNTDDPDKTADIAIIGMAGRYPGSQNLSEFWENLKNGKNCITLLPERVNHSFINTLLNSKLSLPEKYYGGFLEDIYHFDYQLFDIPQKYIESLSLEQRLFLEIAWETFENAGYGRKRLKNIQKKESSGVGVFIGCMYNQYSWTCADYKEALLSSNNTDWQIVNRISHFFDLTGPSLAVNTACSSSLSAIHLAIESIRNGSSCMAIAGGVNLTLNVSKYTMLDNVKFLGSTDRSMSFGKGDGYLPGEGVGAVLLKPLKSAIKDGDPIDAIIKYSHLNHAGGRQKYGAPDPKLQEELITESLNRSAINPETITYVEAAANGSALGDPIEVIALSNAFKKFTQKRGFCALGSVKSNIGHLEAASGISQLTKVVLQLKNKCLVPTINATPTNPNIRLQGAFSLQGKLVSWIPQTDPKNKKQLPLRSMINSFGAGGSYANLIVQEFIESDKRVLPTIGESTGKQILIFSAKTAWSLKMYLKKMQAVFESKESTHLANIAGSLMKINPELEARAVIIGMNKREILEKLKIIEMSPFSNPMEGIYISNEKTANIPRLDDGKFMELVQQDDLSAIAAYWIDGGDVDFLKLFQMENTSFIRLPSYVFDHDEYDIQNAVSGDIDTDGLQEIADKVANNQISEEQFIQLMKMEMGE